MADIDISETDAVETVTVAEDITGSPAISTMSVDPSVVDAVSLADVPSFTHTLKLYRGMNAVTVTAINGDWALHETFRRFANPGMALKGMVFVPGSGAPDTFCIKDGSDVGAILWNGAVAAPGTTVLYPGSMCKPFIDYSACSLSAGHSITFVW